MSVYRTIDAHAAGEPLRLIVDGFPAPKGRTMLEKRRWVRTHADRIRRSLMLEPRGHLDMYGAVLTAPVSPEADAGVLFMHNAGYSTPASASADTGSVSTAPHMSAWPRGSSINARRIESACRLTHARFSIIVRPFGAGYPSTMSRRGSPAAWASMVRKRRVAGPRVTEPRLSCVERNYKLSG
jgi:hypothetical protein